MKFGPFMADLAKGKLKHIYLLAGEEHYYIERAQKKLFSCLFANQQEMNDALQKINGDINIDDLIGLIETTPFFSSKNVLLLRNDQFLKEEKNKSANSKDEKQARLIALFENMPEFSYVIIINSGKVDKRRKLYKVIEQQGAVLEAEAVRAWNINEWLQGKLQALNRDMDREAYAYFNGAVSMMQQISLSYLDKEFDKLALYTDERLIRRQDLQKVFAGLPEVSVFSLLDAISEQKSRKALMLLRRQLADGVYFTVILALLTRHVRQLWQAKVLQAKGIKGKALAKPLELNPFIAERLGRFANNFTETTLKQVMLELIDADYWLKTGQAGDEVLEHAVITLCHKNYAD